LAGLSGCGNHQSPAHGRRADLRSPLCAVHAGCIAGEDDLLDAPDLCEWPNPPSSPARERPPQAGAGRGPLPGPGNGRGRASTKGEPRAILDPARSAELREKLLMEVGNITASDGAAMWAREALAAKNSLTAADAQLVEAAFERRLSQFPSSEAPAPPKN